MFSVLYNLFEFEFKLFKLVKSDFWSDAIGPSYSLEGWEYLILVLVKSRNKVSNIVVDADNYNI